MRRTLWLVLIIFSSAALPIAFAQSAAEAVHVVQPGETLGVIAIRYGVDINSLMARNGIGNAHRIRSWQELAIPGAGYAGAAASGGRHVVQRGETLGEIAKTYGVDLGALRSANGLWNNLIHPGDSLNLPGASGASTGYSPANQPVAAGSQHIVRRGETLGSIAQSYGVSRIELAAINGIWGHIIFPGQALTLPTASPGNATATAPSAPTTSSGSSMYVVRRGDSLGKIAQSLGVSLNALMDANGIIFPHRIDVGQQLTIPSASTSRSAAPASDTSAQRESLPTVNGREQYIVQPGEYLSQIGFKLNMNWVAIADVNSIVNPDRLRVGDVLLLPTADELSHYAPPFAGYQRFNPAANHPGPNRGVGRELVVVLSTQSAYAYEDGILKKAVLVSTGLPATPTVEGNFTIKRKVRRQRMTGPDYDLDNVEWVMYFFAGYAFHGTWWHNNFGTPMSAGCVNMTNADARWFYEFADIGTPVHVTYA